MFSFSPHAKLATVGCAGSRGKRSSWKVSTAWTPVPFPHTPYWCIFHCLQGASVTVLRHGAGGFSRVKLHGTEQTDKLAPVLMMLDYHLGPQSGLV